MLLYPCCCLLSAAASAAALRPPRDGHNPSFAPAAQAEELVELRAEEDAEVAAEEDRAFIMDMETRARCRKLLKDGAVERIAIERGSAPKLVALEAVDGQRLLTFHAHSPRTAAAQTSKLVRPGQRKRRRPQHLSAQGKQQAEAAHSVPLKQAAKQKSTNSSG